MLPSREKLDSNNEKQEIGVCGGQVAPISSKQGLNRPDLEIIISDNVGSGDEPVNSVPGKQLSGAKRSNPFSLFAFQSTGELPPKKKTLSQDKSSRFQKWNPTAANRKKKEAKTESTRRERESPLKMKDLSVEEKERIRGKWHSLVDPEAPLEAKRFQMLVAARLHARCHRASVQKAMARLRGSFQAFSVDTLASTDSESLIPHIKNVVHYNVKAQHIVKAAREIKSKFNGIVPEDEKSLLELTGIGSIFADLLSFVNTRKAYTNSAENE